MNWSQVSGMVDERPDAERKKENIRKAGVFCRIKPYFPDCMGQSANIRGGVHHFPFSSSGGSRSQVFGNNLP